MDKEEIKQKVVDIVADQLDVSKDQISPETSFVDDLGADSLDIAEMVMEFEDEFDLNIPDDQQGFRTIGDAVNYIDEQLKQKSSS